MKKEGINVYKKDILKKINSKYIVIKIFENLEITNYYMLLIIIKNIKN